MKSVVLLLAISLTFFPSLSFAKQEKVKQEQHEKQFSVPMPGGKKIIGYVYPDKKHTGKRKIIIFSPHIEKTDGNLYLAAIFALKEIYGKHRGLIQLNEAKLEFNEQPGGNAICWQIFNPDQKYCIFPVKL